MAVQDGDTARRVVEADKAWSIEQHAIEPIPAADRHGTPIELFRLWIGANINYVVVVTGSLTYAKGLSFWQCMGAILAGNVLGCIVLGLYSRVLVQRMVDPQPGAAAAASGDGDFPYRARARPTAVPAPSCPGCVAAHRDRDPHERLRRSHAPRGPAPDARSGLARGRPDLPAAE